MPLDVVATNPLICINILFKELVDSSLESVKCQLGMKIIQVKRRKWLGEWGNGLPENWSNGVLEYWSTRVLECWSIGLLSY